MPSRISPRCCTPTPAPWRDSPLARDGLAASVARSNHDWLRLCICEITFDLGNIAEAKALLASVPPQLVGLLRIFRALCEADIALVEGEEDRAALALEDVAELVAQLARATVDRQIRRAPGRASSASP